MVKKWITMVVIFIVLLVAFVMESRYINSSLGGLINSLETLQIELTENKDKIDTESLISKSYDLHNKWHEKSKIIKCFVWHSGLKDIEVGLAKISVYIEEDDYTESYAEIASLIDYLAHYKDDFSITIDNIL